MAAHARFSLVWACAGIALICCCIAGIMGEIKDGFVYTDLLKTVRRGDKTSLKCEFLGAPVAVYWKKGNDPDQSPTLITWMDGRKWQGDCAENNWCDIDENFYLIIRNVTIADTGRYVCQVSNYQGYLIHNITDLHVFEPPQEPYPVIEECHDSSALVEDYGCVIRSPTPVNLTCSAFSFFPDLDLFFLHGSEKITNVETQEWTNDDGTRSKSVSISAVPHDTPYVCVASDIPGNQKERAVTVSVCPAQKDDTSTASTGSSTKLPQDINVLIIIIVPLVSVAIVGVCILIVCWRRHHQNDRNHGRHDAESVPLMEIGTITGKLSFYDLWVLVSKATVSDMAKLHDTLRELGITKIGVPGELTHLYAYQHLCKWKSGNVDDDKSEILLAALKKSEYTAAWNDICDVRKNCEMISGGILEHILWQIGDPRKIDKFLSELIPGRTVRNFDVTEKITKFIEEPLGELREWSKGSIDTNPYVLLSLVLESAGCSLVDRTFYCVPDQPVSRDEVQRFVKSLTRRHCESLAKIRDLTSNGITLIVDENQNDLFDTESMIIDWLAQANSSHIDKRCQLNHAAIDIGRHDLKGYFVGYDRSTKLPNTGYVENTKGESVEEGRESDNPGSDLTDAELNRIVQHLGPVKIATSFKEKDDEGKDNFGLLKAWVKQEISAGLPANCRRVLRDKLKPYGKQELIPSESKEDVCLVELADIAFRFMMMDVYPLADALKMSNEKLKLYKRKSLREYQLSRGTIGILVTFCQSTNYARGQLCDALALVAGMREMAHLLRYGYQVSHSDLFSVAYGEGSGIEQCARIRENLGIISETEEEAKDTLDMLRDWRSMIHSPTHNLKGALADAVFPVLGKEKALDILSGANVTSGIQSRNVISFIGDTILYNQASHIANILGVKHSSSESMKIIQVLNVWKDSMKNQELTNAQRGQLCRRLTGEGFKNFSSKLPYGKLKDETGGVTKEMENAIKCDVTTGLAEMLDVKLHSHSTSNVIKGVLDEWQEKIRKKPLDQQERIDLSNKLFKEGFLEFSLEIMMGFVPKPLETTQKETTVRPTVKEAIKKAVTHSGTHHSKTTPGTGGFGMSFGIFQPSD